MRFKSYVAMALMAGSMMGQQARVAPAVPPSGEGAMSILPSQRIGADDLISISVYDSPELTRTVRVTPDGTIRLPLLRQPVSAAGLLPNELEGKIAEELRNERLIVDPAVTVSLLESRSRPISVTGHVKTPVTFQASGSVTLLDALTRAGGLDADAGPEIYVNRPAPDGGQALVTRIPVKGLIESGEPGLNIKLQGGEEIRVPEAGRIYVVGNVKTPGAFKVIDQNDTTVLKVLAFAGGTTAYANKEAFIYRKEGNGPNKNEIPVQLSKILERKAPDVTLQPNDLLYIPDNKGKRMTISTLDRIMMVTGGAVIGALATR